jgi:hypothetical protein
MDKAEFAEKAPLYYAAMMAEALDTRAPAVLTLVEIQNALGAPNRLFLNRPLVDQAIKLLSDEGALTVIKDDFGEDLFAPSNTLYRWYRDLAPQRFSLFRKLWMVGDKKAWLLSAVQKVNEQYDNLKMKAEDFAPFNVETEWEPIPLDRSDESLQSATEGVDAAIEAIEGDNGYAVHAPRERKYVLFNLKNFSKVLKEQSQIYWMQLRTFALEPLARVIKRFGPAATGVVASAAKAAILDWLKKNFAKALDWL